MGSSSDPTSPIPRQPVSLLRVLVIGTALAIPFAFWLQYAEMVIRESLFAVSSALPLPALTGLILLAGLHAFLKLLRLDHCLPRREVLLIYAFLLISVPLGSYGLAQQLLAHLTAGYYYSDPVNGFQTVLGHLPEWIAPKDPDLLKALYSRTTEGASYQAWIAPIARWMVFFVALFCLCLCLSLLLENQWAVSERLRFPLTVPALELTAAGPSRLLEGRLLKSPFLWAGLFISLIINGSAIAHAFLPDFPVVRVFWHLRFQESPWKAATVYMSYRPIALGLAYLAPTDVSLSIWFFELVYLSQRVLSAAFGLDRLAGTSLPTSGARFPYHNEQAFGAFVCVAVVALWRARHHLLTALQAFARPTDSPDARRARGALVGLVLSAGAIVIWLYHAEFWSGAMALFLAMTLLFTLTHSRIRAEAGPPLAKIAPMRSDQMMISLIGTSSFSSASMAKLSVFGFLSGGYFPFLMANQLEGLKLAREARVRRKDLIVTLLVALGVGAFAGIWSLLYFWYTEGADNLLHWPLRGARGSYKAAVAHMRYHSTMDYYGVTAAGVGALCTAGLTLLRRLVWFWPLHPIGYPISQTPVMHGLAFMFFLAWLVKYFVMAYGGVKWFRRTVPFFLGLIFGQIGFLILSNILIYLFHVRIYVSAI